MANDEHATRELITTWHRASADVDVLVQVSRPWAQKGPEDKEVLRSADGYFVVDLAASAGRPMPLNLDATVRIVILLLLLWIPSAGVSAGQSLAISSRHPDIDVPQDNLSAYQLVRATYQASYSKGMEGTSQDIENEIRRISWQNGGRLMIQTPGTFWNVVSFFLSFPSMADAANFQRGLGEVMPKKFGSRTVQVDVMPETLTIQVMSGLGFRSIQMSKWEFFDPGKTQVLACAGLKRLEPYANARESDDVTLRLPWLGNGKTEWTGPFRAHVYFSRCK